jgi:hypothetical protein
MNVALEMTPLKTMLLIKVSMEPDHVVGPKKKKDG